MHDEPLIKTVEKNAKKKLEYEDPVHSPSLDKTNNKTCSSLPKPQRVENGNCKMKVDCVAKRYEVSGDKVN